MFILGMDIGYSNLKLCYGHSDKKPKAQVFPVGAAPIASLSSGASSRGTESQNRGFQVTVNDEEYIACVEPNKLANWQRALHQDYPSTSTYQALFYSALMATGENTIDRLVTGLPVNQFKNRAKDLAAQLKGEHQIAPGRSVTVRQVEVVPQPIGGYFDVLYGLSEADAFDDADVLVLDPGFFSFDWVVIAQNDVQYSWSGTVTQATSMLLEQAAKLIEEEYAEQFPKATIPVNTIERAIRAQKDTIRLFTEQIKYIPFIESASQKIGVPVMNAVQNSLRTKEGNVDVVIMSGGGSPYYLESVKKEFPNSELIVPNNSVLANARGFWFYGLPA